MSTTRPRAWRTGFLAGSILLTLAAGGVALGQPVPESVTVGNGPMTVGYELKTTTHGNGPEGRTASHSLMKYIIPIASANWSAEERAVVDRWSELSIKERTGFFFKAYKGGYNSNNFQANVEKYPYLDKTISWYGSMNIPHIEVRSNPYTNPREALANMKALKADVKETIAFHMHLRFPDTVNAEKAKALTEWLRRTSWAVALKRADYSSKTDFVLKSMDNQPVNVEELRKALKIFSAENPRAQGDIIERRGIRVSRLGNGEERKIDIEFRGLMKDTGRLESYLKATAETFGNGGTNGSKTVYDATNPMFEHSSKGVIKFRSFGSAGKSSWNAGELEWLADEVLKNKGRFNVSSSMADADLRTGVKALATADTEAGKKMLLPSSFNWLFLPLEYDPALPEGVQEQVAKQKAIYTRKLVRLAERVQGGEFGQLGTEGYQPMKTASRARRIIYDFMNEVYKDSGRSAKLFEWYETSVFKPKEIEERTERYRNETGKNRAAEWAAANPPAAEGFAPRRAASDAEKAQPRFDAKSLAPDLTAIREGMVARMDERIAEATGQERAELQRGKANLQTSTFEIVKTSDVLAEAQGSKVRISQGLLDALAEKTANLPSEARRAVIRQAVGLIAAHELAHVSGVKVEKVADMEGVRAYEIARGPLSDMAIRAAVGVFKNPVGKAHTRSLIERLKVFKRYGSERARIRALEDAALGGKDPLKAFRRADGTLKWKELTRSKALSEVGGLAHFGLALFLKEVATVAATGDRSRIEEFYDGLMTTDFYKQYGLFVAGARIGEVAYVKYAQRYIKPGFVNGILKTNLVLGAGLALPMIAEGNFSGKALTISLGSLSLSSAAVKSGAAGIKWVVNLRKARSAGTLARLGLSTRLARMTGWFYTAAELAVVLYLADEVGGWVNEKLELSEARDRMRDAGRTFFKAAGDADATPEDINDAADKYHEKWIDYRNYLYTPLYMEEAVYAERIAKLAKDAKLAADKRAAALGRLESYPALKKSMVRRYGSLEGYADSLVKADEKELDRKADMYSASYLNALEAGLNKVYKGDRRAKGILDGVEDLDWQLLGAERGAAGDPYRTRGDVLANVGRSWSERGLNNALESTSTNRLQAYDDETLILNKVAAALRAQGRAANAEVLKDLVALIAKTKRMDTELIEHKSGIVDAGPSNEGAAKALERMGESDD
ncbi:MAG: hypothetical protein JKY65_18270 [Planctomycetes bacterium]|nr:hypothetical protein [Planctomycetota bacterium]